MLNALNSFKAFQLDRMSIDEMVAHSAFGKLLRAEYEKHNLEEPDFIDTQLKSLHRAITTANAEKLEARRNEIKSRLDSLKTTSQRKQELKEELKQLDKRLDVA
jgi:hypothetical protein